MDIREATKGDRPAIRDVARRSLLTSYTLGPKAITGAISEWYDENRLKEKLANDEVLLLVGEVDGQVVAFSESVITGESTVELHWLHVDPDYRGENFGVALFEATRDHLAERGITNLQGRVLADNSGGNAFYVEQGLSKVGTEQVDIDGTTYLENVYAQVEVEGLKPYETDGETVYINSNNTERGSIAPFYIVYTEETGTDIYGYWCSSCDNLANAMDAMGRIQCDTCGNARKPTRWDSAYL